MQDKYRHSLLVYCSTQLELPLVARLLIQLDGVDDPLQDCAVPIPWFVVTGPLSASVSVQAADPHVVGRVGWVQHSGETGEKLWVVTSFVG